MTFELILVGFGRVARRFVALLDERRSSLVECHGITARVVGIATRRHGCTYAATGVEAVSLARLPEREAIGDLSDGSTLDFVLEVARKSAVAAREARLVVVETTTLDIAQGEPATSHVRAALEAGAHVITANKGPVAFAYTPLGRAAERADRRFLFEGTVLDGVPVFNLVRENLPGVAIVGFRGVVNTTTNYMLTAMEQGQPFEEALTEIQTMGIAEADPAMDIHGWDAAAKTAALANVLLGASLTPHDVERVGITPEMGAWAMNSRASGRRLKLVARAGNADGLISARVGPEELPDDDQLASLEGQQKALILYTDLLGEIAIVQRSGGLTQTAYALVSDLVTIARDIRQSQPRARRDRSR